MTKTFADVVAKFENIYGTQPRAFYVITGDEGIIRAFAGQVRLNVSLGRYAVFGLLVLFLSGLACPSSVHAESVVEGARAHVETLLGEAVILLTDEEATAEDYLDRFRRLFEDYFAVRAIAQWTLGRYWKKATPEQRQEYLRRFEDLIVLGQVKRFRNYTGGRVHVVKATINNANSATVFSTIVPEQGGAAIDINWRVGHRNGIYRITDVVVHGTSMSQTLRSDFGATIRQKGNSVPRFLEEIGKKVVALEAELKTEGGNPIGDLAQTAQD